MKNGLRQGYSIKKFMKGPFFMNGAQGPGVRKKYSSWVIESSYVANRTLKFFVSIRDAYL